MGLSDKPTQAAVNAMQQFATDHGKILEFGYIDFDRVKADAGLQFTSEEFKFVF